MSVEGPIGHLVIRSGLYFCMRRSMSQVETRYTTVPSGHLIYSDQVITYVLLTEADAAQRRHGRRADREGA